MNVSDLLRSFADLAAANPLLLLFTLVGLGSALGAVRIKGFSLGPAAVLFLALGLSAYDDRLKLPAVVGQLGLAVFAYCVGVAAGPSFFAALRHGGRTLLLVVGGLLGVAGIVLALGRALGLSGPLIAGVYAGSLTNTPALAAASEQLKSTEPTVGYSVAYLFGVLGMLAAAALAARTAGRNAPEDVPAPELDRSTVRIDVDGLPDLASVAERYGHRIVFGRIMHGDTPGHPGIVDIAMDGHYPVRGDIVTVIGDTATIEEVTADLGHPSSVPLTLDRSALDYRRIAVSNSSVAGHTLGDLHLARRFGATATRVRRGDVDVLATDDLVLMLGDRVRVVGSAARLAKVAKYLGDSERGASELNPIALGIGLALGLLVGLVSFSLPGGGTFALGVAGGPLLVGLVLGRLQRTGKLLWTMPHSVGAALTAFGMLLFLAYAGSNSGAALSAALRTDAGPRLLLTGAVATTAMAALLLLVGPRLAGLTGPRLAGTVAGAQTQPAVLAYANERCGFDSRVNLGYALVYPVAMIVKVVVAPMLGWFG